MTTARRLSIMSPKLAVWFPCYLIVFRQYLKSSLNFKNYLRDLNHRPDTKLRSSHTTTRKYQISPNSAPKPTLAQSTTPKKITYTQAAAMAILNTEKI